MYRLIYKRFLIVPILIAVFIITFSNSAFAENSPDISQLLKQFQDSDNPIDNSIINSNTNILPDGVDTLDNALMTIYSEPAVSGNYDKICPLFYKSNILGIKVFVDGQLIEFSKYDNVNPAIIEGRVFVPVRALAENLGGTVDWDEKTMSVKVQLFDKVLEIVPDSKNVSVNGKQVTLDVPARMIDGRTWVPVRFIGESLSKTVEWHAYDKTLNVVAIY